MDNGTYLSDTGSIVELNNVRDWVGGRHRLGETISGFSTAKDESKMSLLE